MITITSSLRTEKGQMMSSIFLDNLRYFLGKIDGQYEFPSSALGDLLKQAKKEIEELRDEIFELKSV